MKSSGATWARRQTVPTDPLPQPRAGEGARPKLAHPLALDRKPSARPAAADRGMQGGSGAFRPLAFRLAGGRADRLCQAGRAHQAAGDMVRTRRHPRRWACPGAAWVKVNPSLHP